MLTFATFNVCNLGIDALPSRLERVATVISHELQGPDVLAVQEIKATADNDEGGVPADQAYRQLIEAIRAADGPGYAVREVPPLKNQDGGQAGANIRVGFLFNPRRIAFIDRGEAGPEDATGIRIVAGQPRLTLSPGRIEPRHPAFYGDPAHHWVPSRKALAGEFRFGSVPIFVITCHLKSMRSTIRREQDYAKRQRHAQAAVIHRFVAGLLACDPSAAVVVLGDMNDLPGSKTLKILKGDLLINLLEDIAKSACYTRRHGGRPQALDHVLVSRRLRHGASVRIPHINSDSADPNRASDHDPVLVMLDPLNLAGMD